MIFYGAHRCTVGWSLLYSSLSAACASEYSGKEPPVAVDGVLDLSDWDFSRDGVIELTGDWLFGWDVFIEPRSAPNLRIGLEQKVLVPSTWTQINNSMKKKKLLKDQGHGTYFLEVILPTNETEHTMALSSRAQSTAVNWYVTTDDASGLLAWTSQGRAGRQAFNTIPALHDIYTSFAAADAKRVYIWAHLSNYHHANGGMWSAPLKSQHQVLQTRDAPNFTSHHGI